MSQQREEHRVFLVGILELVPMTIKKKKTTALLQDRVITQSLIPSVISFLGVSLPLLLRIDPGSMFQHMDTRLLLFWRATQAVSPSAGMPVKTFGKCDLNSTLEA